LGEIREKRSCYYLDVMMSVIEVSEVNPGLIYLRFEVIDMHGCDGVSLGEVERKAGVWISKKETNKRNNASNGDIMNSVTRGEQLCFFKVINER